MSRLAKVAVGTVQTGVDPAFAVWALMAAWERAELRVQHFSARACFSPRNGALAITGQATRHLDTWLLEPNDCRQLFARGCSDSNLAVIEGRFESALSAEELVGGKLSTLCEWLDLPAIAIVDACQLNDCELPARPAKLDAVLIDGARCCSEQCRLQTWLEAIWGVPVIGFLENVPQLREAFAKLTPGTPPPKELCAGMAKAISPLVAQKALAVANRSAEAMCSLPPPLVFEKPQRRLRVALAYDEIFSCYFPDALDRFELMGAELIDFSPLRDDRLPPGTDLVYFGCGHPEQHADALLSNCCMIAALRKYVKAGGRLYAECGGLAYLGESIHLPDGHHEKMTGVLPFVATMHAEALPAAALELQIKNASWLGHEGGSLRGYRSGRWSFEPAAGSGTRVFEVAHSDLATPAEILQHRNAIGSCVHLNFAMLRETTEQIFSYQPAIN